MRNQPNHDRNGEEEEAIAEDLYFREPWTVDSYVLMCVDSKVQEGAG